MRFDWYQATVAEHPIVLVEQLAQRLGTGGEVVEGRGHNGYRQGFTIFGPDRLKVAEVNAGGANGDPNVIASGVACDAFVPVFRELWPAHRPTRLDAAEDFGQEGGYDALELTCRAVLAGTRVKGHRVLPDDPRDGRSYVMGAPTSDVRARLYDKAAEQRRRLGRSADIPEHWVRLEAQVRPRQAWRENAAKWEPEHCFATAGWLSEVASQALGLNLERVTMQAGRESDDQRAWRFMLRQYGPLLRRRMAEHGSWCALGCQIGEDLEGAKRI